MFAPDEPGDRWTTTGFFRPDNGSTTIGTTSTERCNSALARQKYMPKYFDIPTSAMSAGTAQPGRHGQRPEPGLHDQADHAAAPTSASTRGKTAIKAAIDAMSPTGNTNVPEGMAWGWRVLSSGAPFTEGRAGDREGQRQGRHRADRRRQHLLHADLAGQRPRRQQIHLCGLWLCRPLEAARLYDLAHFPGHVGRHTTDYSSGNYTKAMDQQFATLCDNAKAARLMVMTVSLDLEHQQHRREKGRSMR